MCIRDRHPSGASEAKFEAISGPAQFKLRMPHTIPHFLGSESSEKPRRAPRSSGELRKAWV
eukprot:2604190-Alexandrium_andersonii.AAC.1